MPILPFLATLPVKKLQYKSSLIEKSHWQFAKIKLFLGVCHQAVKKIHLIWFTMDLDPFISCAAFTITNYYLKSNFLVEISKHNPKIFCPNLKKRKQTKSHDGIRKKILSVFQRFVAAKIGKKSQLASLEIIRTKCRFDTIAVVSYKRFLTRCNWLMVEGTSYPIYLSCTKKGCSHTQHIT